MSFSPRFSYRSRTVGHLMTIEGARRVVDLLPLPPDADLRLRQEARVRSTHHSTKIEGNRLAATAVPHAVVHPERTGQHETEVRNYWRALEWLELRMDDNSRITQNLMRELHRIIFPISRPGRQPRMSEYRTTEIGVIDSRTGNYEYMAPEPGDVPLLMRDLEEWINSEEAAALPGPIRAGILAYQFVTIHPFSDGNGRTARALATLDLWKSGYWMQGFLSMEEYYTRNQNAYYAGLQMGLPANFYEGRNDADLTPWLTYFVEIMAEASDSVCRRAEHLYGPQRQNHPKWTKISRLQQQVLSRCLVLATEGREPLTFTPAEMMDWFEVTKNTVHDWLADWRREGFVVPGSGEQRVRHWRLASEWEELVRQVAAAGSLDQR